MRVNRRYFLLRFQSGRPLRPIPIPGCTSRHGSSGVGTKRGGETRREKEGGVQGDGSEMGLETDGPRGGAVVRTHKAE